VSGFHPGGGMNAIDPASWQRLRSLLEHTLELGPDARQQYLNSLDETDATLVRQMMEQSAPSIPDALQLATKVLAGDELFFEHTRVGKCIGDYRIVRVLGTGGMGVVYLAERTDFSMRVALKLTRKGMSAAKAAERFERERQILAGLKHPGIAALLDGGQTDEGHAYYTMELVDGVPITEFCASRSIEQRVRLLQQVAAALSYAHKNLTVHRDIKPSNVLVTADGQVKIVDFGLAKMLDAAVGSTMTQQALGPMTPAYASPEQFRKGAITVATDIYQFGTLCFMVLAGRLPFRADSEDPLAWATAVTEHEPLTLFHAAELAAADHATLSPTARRRLTGDLDAIVRKALAKAPEERYGSMDALIDDLEAFLRGNPVAARRAGPVYFAWRFAKRWRYAVAATLLAFFALAITALVALQQSRAAAAEARSSTAVANFLISLFRVSDPGVNRGEKLTANQLLDRGAETIDQDLATEPRIRAKLLTVIGDVYLQLGDAKRAEVPLRKAVDTLHGSPYSEPSEMAHTLDSLAWIRYLQGDYSGAEDLLQRAQSNLAEDSAGVQTELATIHNRRGALLVTQLKYDAARSEFEKALQVADASPEVPNLLRGKIHNNFGSLFQNTGNHAAARREFALALSLIVQEYGETHPNAIIAALNLAEESLDVRDPRATISLVQKTQARAKTIFGENDINFAHAEYILGLIERRRGNFAAALGHFSRSEEIYRALKANAELYVAYPLEAAGIALADQGDYASALERINAALDIRRSIAGPDSLVVASSLDASVEPLLGLKRNEEALQNALAALAIRQGKLVAEHPDIVTTLVHVGLAEQAQGNSTGARQSWDEAERRAPRAFSSDSVDWEKLRAKIPKARAEAAT